MSYADWAAEREIRLIKRYLERYVAGIAWAQDLLDKATDPDEIELHQGAIWDADRRLVYRVDRALKIIEAAEALKKPHPMEAVLARIIASRGTQDE